MGFLDNVRNMFKKGEKINQYNKAGKQHGKWELKSEEIEIKGNYMNGKKEGIWTTTYKGTIREENYVNDTKEGKAIEYYPPKLEKDSFGNPQFFPRGIKKEENYVNGIKEGKAIEYYPLTLEKDSFRNSQLLFGKIKEEENYVNDTLDGMSKEYYESGQLKGEVEWQNGKVISVQKYKENGAQDNAYRDYYENGNLKLESEDGIWKEYYENGQLKSIEKYNEDLISLQKYNEKGVLVEEIDKYKSYQRVHERFSELEKGYVRVAKTYDENGKAEGDWKFYKENGNIEKVMLYTDGKLTEESKKEPAITEIGYVHYVYNGHEDVQRIEYAPKEDEYMKIYHLKDGTKDIYHEKEEVTLYEKHNEKGTIVERGQFNEESKQTGTWEYYDNSGKLTEKKEFQEGKEVSKESSNRKKNPWVKSKGKESENER